MLSRASAAYTVAKLCDMHTPEFHCLVQGSHAWLRHMGGAGGLGGSDAAGPALQPCVWQGAPSTSTSMASKPCHGKAPERQCATGPPAAALLLARHALPCPISTLNMLKSGCDLASAHTLLCIAVGSFFKPDQETPWGNGAVIQEVALEILVETSGRRCAGCLDACSAGSASCFAGVWRCRPAGRSGCAASGSRADARRSRRAEPGSRRREQAVKCMPVAKHAVRDAEHPCFRTQELLSELVT